MERIGRKRGSVTEYHGKLSLRFWWRHPDDPYREYRWTVSTLQAATDENRQRLEQRLDAINAKIQAGAFFPCQEFPDSKIAAYCRCASCAVIEPLSNAHAAPRTLGELFSHYEQHEVQRSSGARKVIESSTWRTKRQGMTAMEKAFVWNDGEYDCDVMPLTDYLIRELTPDAVQEWLHVFQHREELLDKGRPPASTSYIKNLLSTVRQALKFGQLKRWWRSHPLLEYQGALIEITKEERNRKMNRTLTQPFSLIERDRVIDWFYTQWQACPETAYNGKEKIRRLFLYHYIVVGFNTGLRSPSEMTALEWSDVDFSRKRLHVRKSREASGRIDEQVIRQYTKTVRHREVPINDKALKSFRALQAYRQEDADWIFWNPRAGKDNPLANGNGWAPLTGEKRIRYMFEKCLQALQIPSPNNQGQYRMRHTFTTLVLDTTQVSDARVAAWIGDSVETMRAHYQGHCKQRWRDEDDVVQLNELNRSGKGQLKVLK